MHRVFRTGGTTEATGDHVAGLRAFLRDLGFTERPAGNGWTYECMHPGGGVRHFATLHGRHRHATIYFYPDALGRPPGHATAFYRVLDDAGLEMGSKAGPSIGIDLENDVHATRFREELRRLLGAE